MENTTTPEWAGIVDKNIDRLADALSEATAKAGPAMEHGWEIMVRGEIAEGVTNLVTAVIFACFTVFMMHLVRQGLPLMDGRETEERGMAQVIFGGILGVVCIIVTLVQLHSAVPRLVAPEYYAAKTLMGLE